MSNLGTKGSAVQTMWDNLFLFNFLHIFFFSSVGPQCDQCLERSNQNVAASAHAWLYSLPSGAVSGGESAGHIHRRGLGMRGMHPPFLRISRVDVLTVGCHRWCAGLGSWAGMQLMA